MKIFSSSIILFFLAVFASNAQNLPANTNQWRFGSLAGINLNLNPIVGISSSNMITIEGSASIADDAGNLLFYSNGKDVYNSNNDTLINGGTTLNGSITATQSALFIKKPGSPNRYLLFTLGNAPNNAGLFCTELDITLNGGLGGIVPGTLNSVVYAGATAEKLTATRHCNGVDYWVLTVNPNGTLFRAILVNNTGFAATPVSTTIGTAVTGAITEIGKGYMKISPNGKKIGLAFNKNTSSSLRLLDFNNSTGVVTNPIDLPAAGGEYGIAFSNDNSKLFVSCSRTEGANFRNELYQFDLLTTTPVRYLLLSRVESLNKFGALQLASNGRIYLSQRFIDQIHVINNPTDTGFAVNYADSALTLPNSTTRLGLPNFMEAPLGLPIRADFRNESVCIGTPMQFNDSSRSFPVSWSWNFGDPTSGANNTSNIPNPLHDFTSAGTYQVTLIVTDGCGGSDTVVKPITIGTNLPVDLGIDSLSGCIGDTFTLVSNLTSGTFTWAQSTATPPVFNPNGNSTQSQLVTTSGWYRLTVNIPGCSGADSVIVNINTNPPVVNLGPDTTICSGNSITLDAGNPGATYLWSTGDVSQTIAVTTADTITVFVDDQGCTATDTVIINVDIIADAFIGNDTTICPGDEFILDVSSFGTGFLWSTGETTGDIVISEAGLYSVVITTTAGCEINSNEIEVIEECPVALFMPSAFSPNGDGRNDLFIPIYNRVTIFNLQIYDRFGGLMFETKNVDQGWDGRINGVVAPQGSYSYIVSYFDEDENATKQLSGKVVVLR